MLVDISPKVVSNILSVLKFQTTGAKVFNIQTTIIMSIMIVRYFIIVSSTAKKILIYYVERQFLDQQICCLIY